MAEKKQSKHVNGVVITVYVESATTPLRQNSESVKKTKPHPHSRRPRSAAASTEGYDRRAHLLAYSRQLRNDGSEEVHKLPGKQSPKAETKKCMWLNQSVQICSSASRMLRQSHGRWRYERMTVKDNKEMNPPTKKSKASEKTKCTLLKKLKNMLRELSCKEIKW